MIVFVGILCFTLGIATALFIVWYIYKDKKMNDIL